MNLKRQTYTVSCIFCLLLTPQLASCGGSGGSSTPTTNSAPSNSAVLLAQASTWLTQNAHEVTTVDPANENFSDLQAFGDAIGDARIVALGEQSHGGGTDALMRARLVKYLHQKKGFEVVMYEAGIFGAFRMQQLIDGGKKLDDIAAYEFADTFALSGEARKILQYIDSARGTATPLMFTGMDSNQTGKYARQNLVAMLETYLNAAYATTTAQSNWSTYKTLAQQLVTRNMTLPSAADQAAFYAMQDNLESVLCASQTDSYVFPDSAGLWCQIIKGMRNQSTRYWGPTGENGYRDASMASNAQWLLEHTFKNRKVIILSHIVHSMYFDGSSRLGQSVGGGAMGSFLKTAYGSQYYVTDFTSSSGAYRVSASPLQTATISADEQNSLEDVLHKMNKPLLFIDARSNPPPAALFGFVSREVSYDFTTETALGKYQDGKFYIDTLAPYTVSRTCTVASDSVTVTCT